MEDKLFKHCRREHNLAEGCDTIVLGTLEYYSELDPNYSISDPKEGSSSTKRNEDEVFMKGSHFGGKMIDCSVVGGIKVRSHNFYIFSLTRNEENKDWDEYDSKYEVTRIKEFKQLVAQALIDSLTLGDLKDCDTLIKDLRNVIVHAQSSDIHYIDDPELTDENYAEVLKDIYDPIKTTFTKEKKFSSENEMRIAFIITDANGKLIEVKKKPKVLNLRRVNSYIG